METKINIILLVTVIIIFGCNNESIKKSSIQTENYDTIYSASENSINKIQSAYLVEGAIGDRNHVALKSLGESKIVWIDSILYNKKGGKSFFSIIREPTRGYYVLYYNGDSLIEQVVSKKCPKIDINIEDREFTEITIRDSMYNPEFLDLVFFKYTLSDSCLILNKEENFSKIPINN